MSIYQNERGMIKHMSEGYFENSLHKQLRLGRSFLAAHSFAINLHDDDLCICSRPETTTHFFTCFIYQEEQKILHEKVKKKHIPKFSTFSTKKQVHIFLHGINSEPDPRNIPIVFAVQEYILQTKRFAIIGSSPPTHPTSSPPK